MVVEGDQTDGVEGRLRVDEADSEEVKVKSKSTGRLAHRVLEPKEVTREFIKGQTSDVQGLMQLVFHGACAYAAGCWITYARNEGAYGQFVLAELCLGFVASFYFAGFHEMIHNTAFASRWANKAFAHVVGFAIFRGANWYWYFHWHHHRFTNDPLRDPELSGTTVDRADPTLADDLRTRLWGYTVFLSGYPFGFERLLGIAKHAAGTPEKESWIDTPKKARAVQLEYVAFVVGYSLLAAAALARPSTWGASLWFYWILPHMVGAGHLRYYQTAEHRACKMGEFTDTNAWVVSRTTATWWFYCALAWNMPYHQEHHAWPNVPFHRLPQLHAKVMESPNKPESGCSPVGDNGYAWMHWVLLKQLIDGPAKPEATQKVNQDAAGNAGQEAADKKAL